MELFELVGKFAIHPVFIITITVGLITIALMIGTDRRNDSIMRRILAVRTKKILAKGYDPYTERRLIQDSDAQVQTWGANNLFGPARIYGLLMILPMLVFMVALFLIPDTTTIPFRAIVVCGGISVFLCVWGLVFMTAKLA